MGFFSNTSSPLFSGLSSTVEIISPPTESKNPGREILAEAVIYAIRHTPPGSLIESAIDNVIRDKVTPNLGSILHCSLYGAEHTGIYVGANEIIDLTGEGKIRITDPKGFLQNSNAITIYVACTGTNPLGDALIAARARSRAGSTRKYNVLFDNCHQFTAGCICGDFENYRKTFFLLGSLITSEMGAGESINWRAWDLKASDLF